MGGWGDGGTGSRGDWETGRLGDGGMGGPGDGDWEMEKTDNLMSKYKLVVNWP